jgi:hypothetical protein
MFEVACSNGRCCSAALGPTAAAAISVCAILKRGVLQATQIETCRVKIRVVASSADQVQGTRAQKATSVPVPWQQHSRLEGVAARDWTFSCLFVSKIKQLIGQTGAGVQEGIQAGPE